MDKYDEAIEWLVANPGRLMQSWGDGGLEDSSPAACLFAFCGGENDTPDRPCGCLTMVHNNNYWAYGPDGIDEAITAEIRRDDRIPGTIRSIAYRRGDALLAALQPFAEWQRRLDREIRGGATATA